MLPHSAEATDSAADPQVCTASAPAMETANVSDAASAKLVVASTPACSYCKRAKQALDAKGLKYVDVDVSSDPGLRSAFSQVSGQSSVPQVRVWDYHPFLRCIHLHPCS